MSTHNNFKSIPFLCIISGNIMDFLPPKRYESRRIPSEKRQETSKKKHKKGFMHISCSAKYAGKRKKEEILWFLWRKLWKTYVFPLSRRNSTYFLLVSFLFFAYFFDIFPTILGKLIHTVE